MWLGRRSPSNMARSTAANRSVGVSRQDDDFGDPARYLSGGAADEEIPAVISTSPDQNVDMRIVGIPVIDPHPVKLRSKVALNIAQ